MSSKDLRTRDAIKKRISKHEKAADNHTTRPLTRISVASHLETLEKIFEAFETIHYEILDAADPADLDTQQKIYDDFESEFMAVQLKLKVIEADLASQPVTSSNRMPAGSSRGRNQRG
ncbi:unnamed protein product [Allacma fusca]|uniref:Uncharacterized protein n=1 Tax=Allacma fusca TaxID=39272 RepID=A0A8J2PKG5_9HEXA|nr:unnamed protein product [Allacma fusca]